MALETLKDLTEIGGVKINRSNPNCECGETDFIHINDNHNTIMFNIQKGPIKENGVNGCQVDTLIETARAIICGLNEKFPNEHNVMVMAINQLSAALDSLKLRTADRESRGVEGTSQG